MIKLPKSMYNSPNKGNTSTIQTTNTNETLRTPKSKAQQLASLKSRQNLCESGFNIYFFFSFASICCCASPIHFWLAVNSVCLGQCGFIIYLPFYLRFTCFPYGYHHYKSTRFIRSFRFIVLCFTFTNCSKLK